MNPTLNEGSVLQHFEHGNAIEIRNEIMFDFYPGLPRDLTLENLITYLIRRLKLRV